MGLKILKYKLLRREWMMRMKVLCWVGCLLKITNSLWCLENLDTFVQKVSYRLFFRVITYNENHMNDITFMVRCMPVKKLNVEN